LRGNGADASSPGMGRGADARMARGGGGMVRLRTPTVRMRGGGRWLDGAGHGKRRSEEGVWGGRWDGGHGPVPGHGLQGGGHRCGWGEANVCAGFMAGGRGQWWGQRGSNLQAALTSAEIWGGDVAVAGRRRGRTQTGASVEGASGGTVMPSVDALVALLRSSTDK
jgi:hypothetical protein